MMDRFPLDSVLPPFNLICYARGPWPEGGTKNTPKAWYQPSDLAEEARNAVRFTLSEDVTSAVSPGVTFGSSGWPWTLPPNLVR